MIDFGKLDQVKKTYEKESAGPRGQNYEGLKFRRSLSKAGKALAEKEGREFSPEVQEILVFSNKIAEKLDLANTGFIEFADGQRDEEGKLTKVEKVFLAHLDDEHEDCKILKSTSKGEKKSLNVKLGVMFGHLVEAGILDGEKMGNQYLSLVKEDEVQNLPDFIKGLYRVVVDTSVNEAEVEEEEEEEEAGNVPATSDERDF